MPYRRADMSSIPPDERAYWTDEDPPPRVIDTAPVTFDERFRAGAWRFTKLMFQIWVGLFMFAILAGGAALVYIIMAATLTGSPS